jgi:tryptophanyl-tRNA synthetase
LINELRQAVGLRRMVAVQQPKAAAAQQAKSALPVFKQYREADNKFYFKLTDAHGALLLQSEGFTEGREAGGWVKRFKTEGAAALAGAPVAVAEGVDRAAVEAALAALLAAQE